MARRSKYPSIGILEAIEKLAFGGYPHSPTKKNVVNKRGLYNYFSKNDPCFDPVKFSKRIYDIKRNGLIEYNPNQDFIITKRGREKINFKRIEGLSITNCKKDGWWRVIIFDIPEQRRGTRDILRSKLNEFNCYQVQKSVYVIPYSCEREIEELCSLLGINKYVVVVLAKSLGQRENKIRSFFSGR